jgi:hypothetical protein
MSEDTNQIPATTEQKSIDAAPIVARYDLWYRLKQSIVVLICVGGGLWCLFDGFYRFPKENADATRRGQTPPHGPWDAPLNKGLGLALPPLGFFLLYRMLRATRGEYRLDGQTLHIPGHPPIPLSSIRLIDKAIWDRKGIARIQYEVGDSDRRRSFKLDDIAYQREPTDKILDQIEAYAASVAAAAAPDESPGTP